MSSEVMDIDTLKAYVIKQDSNPNKSEAEKIACMAIEALVAQRSVNAQLKLTVKRRDGYAKRISKAVKRLSFTFSMDRPLEALERVRDSIEILNGGEVMPAYEFVSEDSFYIEGRGRVYVVRAPEEFERGSCPILGEDVIIDGTKYHCTGVESMGTIREGDSIGLLVREIKDE